MAIARARVYHSVPFDVRNLVTSSVATLRSQGPPDDQVVETFERRFAEHVGAAHCVSFAFARTAVHQALESQALAHGSEVLMPPITISPMMDAVLSLGLRPVFVDIDPNSLIFDVEAFERAITPNTRAALITYLFGIAADPTPLIEVAARAGLFVIEDFSHNLGASVGGRSLGTFGDVGVYSCSATKTLDAYGGGLAVTNSTSLAGLLRTAQRRLPHPPARRVPPKVLVDLAWNAGSHKSMWSAVAFPLIRALRRWAPGVEDAISGANTPGAGTGELAPEAFERLSAHQARVGLAVLPSVEPGNEQRRRDAERLRGALRGLGCSVPQGAPAGVHVFWQTVVVVDDPAGFQRALARLGIDTAPTNLPLLSDGGLYPDVAKSCTVAERIKQRAFYVPMNNRMSRRDRARVTDAVVQVLGGRGGG